MNTTQKISERKSQSSLLKVKTEKQPKQLGVRWWKDLTGKRYSGYKTDISREEYTDCLMEIIKQTLNHVKALKARKI